MYINCVNWPKDYPYCPETTVEISHDATKLRVHFHVRGEQLLAKAMHDGENVWEDSCVEFFCQVPGEDTYCNFETNCIGTMVATRRKGRNEDVQPFPPEQMALIERHTTLPHQPIQLDGVYEWDVEIAIPLSLILRTEQYTFPLTLKANFYKCADGSHHPHYVSWKPIDLPHPDFHCPQFFGEIVLAVSGER